ncbi:MAG: sugar ABC transporter permease YjfF [Lachnoclostridium sp.]|jgi:simple sugar transport system permease protein|nr:sugar ABC transporter permease YjfF [Lachnoclostridium sp.]
MKNNKMPGVTPISIKPSKKLSNTGVLLMITIGLFVLLYLISIIMFQDGNFAKFSVFFNFLNGKAFLLMLALGLTVVMITGSIDISVGGVTGLVGMVIAVMMTEYGVSAGWTIPAAIVIGLLFGIVQGYLIAYMEIQPFIVTLAGMFFARGMISVVNSSSVPISNTTFLEWSSAKIFIPFLFNERQNGTRDVAYLTPAAIIALITLIILIIVLKKTRFGRSLYAVGGNAQSALLMGINVRKTKLMAHVLCGLLAGIGGLLFTLLSPSGNPGNGRGYEIDAISSSVIGGTMLSGGVGLPIGTFFGVLINGLVDRVVPLFGIVEASWPRIITSAFLFFFIVLQSILAIVSKKRGASGK